jgi:S-adenosylmethionine/arginine decarboxylase-like enzyme
MSYGIELIIDLHECNTTKFNRKDIKKYFKELCELIDMQAEDCHFWDDEGVPEEEKQTDPHTKGISAIQFILTSNITIHTLDLLEKVFINIFSCKDFDKYEALEFSRNFFEGKIVNNATITRI